jgi:hypothetical protein
VFSYGKYKKRCNYPNPLIEKEKAIISDGFLLFAPLLDRSCNFNAMIDFVTIRKLKGWTSCKFAGGLIIDCNFF